MNFTPPLGSTKPELVWCQTTTHQCWKSVLSFPPLPSEQGHKAPTPKLAESSRCQEAAASGNTDPTHSGNYCLPLELLCDLRPSWESLLPFSLCLWNHTLSCGCHHLRLAHSAVSSFSLSLVRISQILRFCDYLPGFFLPVAVLLASKLVFFHLYLLIFIFSLLVERGWLKQRGRTHCRVFPLNSLKTRQWTQASGCPTWIFFCSEFRYVYVCNDKTIYFGEKQ